MDELFETYLRRLKDGVYLIPLFKPVLKYAYTRYGLRRIDWTIEQKNLAGYAFDYDTREDFDTMLEVYSISFYDGRKLSKSEVEAAITNPYFIMDNSCNSWRHSRSRLQTL